MSSYYVYILRPTLVCAMSRNSIFDDLIPDCPTRTNKVVDATPLIHILRIEAIQRRIHEWLNNNEKTTNKNDVLRRLKYTYDDLLDPTITVPMKYAPSDINDLILNISEMARIIYFARNAYDLTAAYTIGEACIDALNRVRGSEVSTSWLKGGLEANRCALT
jgi:hypothetical protein